MKRYILVFLLLAAVSTAAVLAQSSRQAVPRDDAYVSTLPSAREDDAGRCAGEGRCDGRLEWRRELMGGDLTPEFMEAVMTAPRGPRWRSRPLAIPSSMPSQRRRATPDSATCFDRSMAAATGRRSGSAGMSRRTERSSGKGSFRRTRIPISRTWTSWRSSRSTTTWCSSIRAIRREIRCTSAVSSARRNRPMGATPGASSATGWRSSVFPTFTPTSMPRRSRPSRANPRWCSAPTVACSSARTEARPSIRRRTTASRRT